jgi:ketosteroid isomerase-like protein
MSADPTAELLAVNQRLLDCIARGDWVTYQELCDPSLTAFEPEACGQFIEGLAFHHFYFDQEEQHARHQTTMIRPHVRLLGDAAVVCYVRLNQRADAEGRPHTAAFEETRVWHRRDGQWRHVHFHRSAVRPA